MKTIQELMNVLAVSNSLELINTASPKLINALEYTDNYEIPKLILLLHTSVNVDSGEESMRADVYSDITALKEDLTENHYNNACMVTVEDIHAIIDKGEVFTLTNGRRLFLSTKDVITVFKSTILEKEESELSTGPYTDGFISNDISFIYHDSKAYGVVENNLKSNAAFLMGFKSLSTLNIEVTKDVVEISATNSIL